MGDARPNVAPAPPPRMESFDMPAVFGHVHEQVQDVNWGKFGIDTFNHAKQCIPHCVKYVLPKHEGKNLLHVAGQVGHCLLWECLPQAFRNAGKPGPFVADAMDVFQAQMESNARERAEHIEHVAWAVACVCALVAAGLAVLQNQRKERKAREALLAGPQGLAGRSEDLTEALALVPA